MKTIIPTLVFLLSAASLAAHPHVWAEVKAEVTVTAGLVEGVWTQWTFDDAFSQLILADNDANADGQLTAAESATTKKTYFDNLRRYQYFGHFGLGSRTIEPGAPTQFTASVANNRVVFRFFLPLGVRFDAKTPLAVSFYDDTFFTDMVFEKQNPLAVTVSGAGKATVAWRKDPSKTFYGGQITPLFAFISWSAP